MTIRDTSFTMPAVDNVTLHIDQIHVVPTIGGEEGIAPVGTTSLVVNCTCLTPRPAYYMPPYLCSYWQP